VIPDEVIRYAIGRFGKPNVPLAAHVRERIETLPRTRELRAESSMPEVEELRARFGARLSDEELLLRATMPPGQVDAMLAAPPASRRHDPEGATVMTLITKLLARRDLTQVTVQKPGFRLELRRASPPPQRT
jgi:oxaloacetate decarboxylase alpha subunit